MHRLVQFLSLRKRKNVLFFVGQFIIIFLSFPAGKLKQEQALNR